MSSSKAATTHLRNDRGTVSSTRPNPLQQAAPGKSKVHAKPGKAEAEVKAKTAATASPRKNHELLRPMSSRKKASTSDDIATALKSADGCDPNQELRQVQNLLAQIWHRNKNQHRGQKWWKWVSVLKRRVRDLVELVDDGRRGDRGVRRVLRVRTGAEEEVSEAVLARKRMERERVRQEQRRQVEEWMREVMLGKCWLASTRLSSEPAHLSSEAARQIPLIKVKLASYRAFSTLVADPQFCTLGIVLLAILARVGRFVGLPKPLPTVMSDLKSGQQQQNTILATSVIHMGVDRGEVVERAFDGSGQHKGSTRLVENREERVVSMARVARDREAGEEALKPETRDEELVEEGDEGETRPHLTSAGESKIRDQSKSEAVTHGGIVGKEPAAAERRKKRRKKGNAIDELFAGLS